MRTTDNTILITGGTSGIGRGFAEEFYKRGNTVIICGRREEKLQEIKENFPGIITTICDMNVVEEREALFQWAVESYPDLNILMNNAGIQLLADMTKEVDIKKVSTEVETNLIAPIHLASLFAPHFTGKDESAIIKYFIGTRFCSDSIYAGILRH